LRLLLDRRDQRLHRFLGRLEGFLRSHRRLHDRDDEKGRESRDSAQAHHRLRPPPLWPALLA
jgi:hypothetical protein